MYLDHFKLMDKPFRENTDPHFLWRGEKHAKALEMMHTGLVDNCGLLLLTGDVGTGKTTLISTLMSQLDDGEVAVAKIPNPGVEPKELFLLVSHAFGLRRRVQSRNEFIALLTHYLNGIFEEKQKALLIIDEAQIMSAGTLEEIRSLASMEFFGGNRLNIFLAGQTELDQLLLAPENWAIRDQIALRYKLTYLSEPETAAYIKHRLRVAGAQKRIFTDEAIHEIFELANGSPRQINNICDIALLYAFEKSVRVIDRQLIAESKETVITDGDWGGQPKGRTSIPGVVTQGAAVPIDQFEVKENAARVGQHADQQTRQDTPVPKGASKPKPRPPLALLGIVFLLLLAAGGVLLYSGGDAGRFIGRVPLFKSMLPAPAQQRPIGAGNEIPAPNPAAEPALEAPPPPAVVAPTATTPVVASQPDTPAVVAPADPPPAIVPESRESGIASSTVSPPMVVSESPEPTADAQTLTPPAAVPELQAPVPALPEAADGATVPEKEDVVVADPAPTEPPNQAPVETQDDTELKKVGEEQQTSAVVDGVEENLPSTAAAPEPTPQQTPSEVVEIAAPPPPPGDATIADKPPAPIEEPVDRQFESPAPEPPPVTETPFTESPDPSDIIDWLLRENNQSQ
jgi:type II secretory pathway predicted ATPase ExeA